MEGTHSSSTPRPAVRRLAISLSILAAVLVSVALSAPRNAQAGLSWCGADPLITIDGKAVDITAYVPAEEILSGNVDGPIVYVVHAPKGSKGVVVLKPDVLVRQVVRFVYDQPRWSGNGTLEVPVDVIVKAKSGSFDVMVTTLNTSLGAGVTYGTTKSPVLVTTHVEGQLVQGAVKNIFGLLD